MKPLSPLTDKGRTVVGDDIHHKTRDTSRKFATSKAKAMRHAARYAAKKEDVNETYLTHSVLFK